jgi:DNA invertase Pin-like site-specific DNA recombinase
MDRLSRSLADVATLHEQCRFLGIQIVTREEGVLTPMHIGMKGTMNAESLAVTATKTRDALRHRFKMGQNPGGMSYGYQARIEHDGNGDRIKGLVQIITTQAHVVNFIMTEYVAGRSPGSIAKDLNRRGEPAPRSAKRKAGAIVRPAMWGGNTITGNAARGTGILNNILYIG